jgi:hypothetical protein
MLSTANKIHRVKIVTAGFRASAWTGPSFDKVAFLLINNEAKKSKLRIRNMIFTVRAKGGAPSGHSCPISTRQLSRIRIAIAIRVVLEFGFIDIA